MTAPLWTPAPGRVAAANLVAGAFDLGMTPSQRTAEDGLVIPLESLQACYRHTFPGLDREDRRHPSISPLYADLDGNTVVARYRVSADPNVADRASEAIVLAITQPANLRSRHLLEQLGMTGRGCVRLPPDGSEKLLYGIEAPD